MTALLLEVPGDLHAEEDNRHVVGNEGAEHAGNQERPPVRLVRLFPGAWMVEKQKTGGGGGGGMGENKRNNTR